MEVPKNLVLCQAAANGNLEYVTQLLKSDDVKKTLNEGDYDTRTALHLACEEGHLDVVKVLVENGASVNVRDRWGGSPLRISIRRNHNEISNFLKEKGAAMHTPSQEPVVNEHAAKEKLADKIERIRFRFDNIEKDDKNDILHLEELRTFLCSQGIDMKTHTPIQKEVEKLAGGKDHITWNDYLKFMLSEETTLQRALSDNLAVTEWESFVKELTDIYNEVQKNKGGHNADYIPELGTADPNQFAVSVVSVDGQRFEIGPTKRRYPIESCVKPLSYAVAVQDTSYDEVHKYVGKEPSGRLFNAFALNHEDKPHNACINAGAIMVSALFHPEMRVSKRYKYIQQRISELAGGQSVGFSQSVYLSEKETANTNHALAYFMASKYGFPEDTNIEEALDFYLQLCSAEVDTNVMSMLAATFANYGVCPINGKRELSFNVVKRTMQLCFSCGMYDYSGEWACTVGLPAKSGVSGEIFCVVPGKLGFCVWSPPLDIHGNSVRGVDFCTRVAEKFGWNLFDVLYHDQDEDESKED